MNMTAMDKILEWDAKYGEDWSNSTDMIAKIMEEYLEDGIADYINDQDFHDAAEN